MEPPQKHEKIKLVEINSYLTCYLCKGYLIDATTISECLHSFCRSCIIRFLQVNCYCPICEVIINKAKPCLKLDKALQDIVYKSIPGLFTNEMSRRKEYYKNKPELLGKVSPEERGEDTERTIFNPQDTISLSIEYVSDDSTPGAIPDVLSLQKLTKKGVEAVGAANDENQDNLMKRYLQCPGMCRIEVLKKFVRNKYNVDTNLFHIDILYKRVPLPDHYTLIDIGYIYSWKRNEPMKFFFRITDITKVAERFDYFDGRVSPEIIHKPPRIKNSTPAKSERKKEAAILRKNILKDVVNSVKLSASALKSTKIVPRVEENKVNEVTIKPEVKEEIKNKLENGDVKNVYTNITLNRADNVEIITKIQKVSNKEGQPIGLNIINHTVKKTKVQKKEKDEKTVSSEDKNKEENDVEKSNFLKSIDLAPKDAVANMAVSNMAVSNMAMPKEGATKLASCPQISHCAGASGISSAQKRKNSSPVKNEKRVKVVKKPMKIVPKNVGKTKPPDIKTLIDNCKINIPSSLSITLNESSGGGVRTPPLIPPVKNYIEILKLPETSEKMPTHGQTFQKIFEQSISKTGVNGHPQTPTPLDLTSMETSTSKRRILDIASQLQKKSKMELEKKKEEIGKIAIPRLATQRTLKPQNKGNLGVNVTVSVTDTKANSKSPPKRTTTPSGSKPKLNSNQILEKYNIQNLPQLTASFNLSQYGALQHAMLLKQLEHQSWFNQGPLLQYEKYLQSLNATQNKIMGNIKEN